MPTIAPNMATRRQEAAVPAARRSLSMIGNTCEVPARRQGRGGLRQACRARPPIHRYGNVDAGFGPGPCLAPFERWLRLRFDDPAWRAARFVRREPGIFVAPARGQLLQPVRLLPLLIAVGADRPPVLFRCRSKTDPKGMPWVGKPITLKAGLGSPLLLQTWR
jgi:hypothetical protein